MMISPEGYYEFELKGKSAYEIRLTIGDLKEKISQMKHALEMSDLGILDELSFIMPNEQIRISFYREYLELAIRAYKEVGGVYKFSKRELAAARFQRNIPDISSVTLIRHSYGIGSRTFRVTIDGDSVAYECPPGICRMGEEGEPSLEERGRDSFLEGIAELHLGEWRSSYDSAEYGVYMKDGEEWELEVRYRNDMHRPFRFRGVNVHPYNFGELEHLLELCE